MFTVMQDIRLAVRQMWNAPGFAVAAVLTLALGIGANTAMFTVIDNVLIRPMPYRQAERLVSVGQVGRDGDFGATSWPSLQDLRKQAKTLQDVGGYVTDVAILQGKEGGKTLLGTKVTCNVIDLLGAQPAIGHGFSEGDCAEGAAPVVLLSDALWRQDFGADPHIVGRQVLVGNVPHTVVGVMPAQFSFPEEAGAGTAAKGVWLASRLSAEIRARGFTLYEAIGRLRPGATVNQARAEMATVAKNIRRQDPKAGDLSFHVRSYRDTITGAVRPVFYALGAALGLVLLIACANVANLQLSRCLARHHEFAVRAALGAPKWRLVRELVVESGMLSVLGAAVGSQLALGILQLLRLLPEDLIPRAGEIQLRWGVLAMLAGLAMAATLVSGIVPALFAMRTEPQNALRGAGRGVSQRAGTTRMAGWVVIGEVAIAGVLLVGCSLLFHTLYNLEHKQLGFAMSDVVTFTATPPTSAGYLGGPARGDQRGPAITTRMYAPLLTKLRALPGVKQAALSSSIPFDGVDLGSSFSLNDKENKSSREKEQQDAILRVMSGGFMQAMGTPILQGREISDEDAEESQFVAVVNEAFARKFLGGRNALGQTLGLGGKDTGMEKSYTIVGVAADAAQKNLVERAVPEMDLSYRQVPQHSLFYPILLESATKFVVRATPGQNVSGAIRSVVRKEAPGFAIDDLQTMQKTVDKADFSQRLGFYLTGGFAGVAVLMVMVGLYGVLAQLVSQRRQEIGVRVALGATSSSILTMILRQGAVLIVAGVVIGLAAAGALGHTIQSFLYEVKPTDLWSYAGVAAALLAVGLLAAVIPAWRASTIEPVEALRTE
ncbi:MAG TPA: ABC transporter permease [Bryobacteraceae bacterium]|jgi:predicted permease|nr:ABC transporter permease [Bryobacteraceae bacterium]